MPAVPWSSPARFHRATRNCVRHSQLLRLSCNSVQSLIRTMPDNMSHSITMDMRVTPNSMINPSRVVNFDRFTAPLQS
jgi:hypothetical protein